MKKAIVILSLFVWANISAYSNSAEPPAMIVLVEFAPDDLQLSLRIDGLIQLDDEKKDTVMIANFAGHRTAWETRFSLHRWNFLNDKLHWDFMDNSALRSATLIIYSHSQGKSFEIPHPTDTFHYRNWYTLDLKNQTLIEGQTVGRITALVSLRVILTLLIEGGIFFLFGFRQRRSWIMFLIINLLTQGALNLSLTLDTFHASYIILLLIFYEILIALVEAAAFLLTVKEHGIARKLLYVLLANLASLLLGGFLIDCLPV